MITLVFHAVLSAVLLHPVHETICELQWNADEKCTEVSLRLSVLDEQWIEKQWKKTVQSDALNRGSEDLTKKQPWQIRFLRSQLVFDPVKRKSGGEKWVDSSAPTRWVGRKEDGAHVWWFFEVISSDSQPPKTVESRLLFDRDSNYQHRVLIQSNGRTIVLRDQETSGTLRF